MTGEWAKQGREEEKAQGKERQEKHGSQLRGSHQARLVLNSHEAERDKNDSMGGQPSSSVHVCAGSLQTNDVIRNAVRCEIGLSSSRLIDK